MQQNAYLLAKVGADTAENERTFADILPETDNRPTGPLPSAAAGVLRAGLPPRARAAGPLQPAPRPHRRRLLRGAFVANLAKVVNLV